MCGIAGFLSNHKNEQHINAAIAALQHRGPEASGVYKDPSAPLLLGHSRLCIIDTSSAAAQPMRYQNRYEIVHNGELYNYIELRQQLQAKGLPFSTQSDTEVIVAAFAQWGKSCLQYFDGAFAFAIWDEQEKTLFIARDRMGEKPVFFSMDASGFYFASEMKALWQMGISKVVNRNMLYNYLTIGYTSNPFNGQETFFDAIYKLPAASLLQYKISSEEVSIEQYWQVAIEEKPISDEEALHNFSGLLTTSIHRRLRSDVPVGTSLSGGLDSSSIVALCATQQASNYTHQCFTASFENFAKDETKIAAQVAAKFGLKHHIIPVGTTDLLHNMQALSYHQEEPLQSASVLAQYQVYQAAKAAGITVMLDGQGADEILAGYHKYYHWYWQELFAKKQLTASGELQAARKLGVTEPFGLKNKTAAVWPHFTASLWQKQKARKAAAQQDLHPAFVAANKNAFAYAQPVHFTLNGVLHYNTFTNGLEELLRYADRNSMAHAVEVRLPFLSHQLVEFLFTLPPAFKIRNGWTKWLLRASMKDILSEAVTWRKDKVGFEPPQQQWMQDQRIQNEINAAKQVLADEQVLSPTALKRRVIAAGAHAASNHDWRYWSASYLFR